MPTTVQMKQTKRQCIHAHKKRK